MNLDEFDYHLPQEQIASTPLEQRDHSKLMVVDRQSEAIVHDQFSNIAQHLPEKAFFVINNTKVVPVRLLGHRQGSHGQVEVFVLKTLDDQGLCEVLMKPLRRLKNGDVIVFDHGYQAIVVDRETRQVRFSRPNVLAMMEEIGHMPLPPYIQRPDNEKDRTLYQTVYAEAAGSVAAPTAGRHFTTDLIQDLTQAQHPFYKLTLHINYGTFKPVEVKNVADHQMHTEDYMIESHVYDDIVAHRQAKRSLVAVGTTSCRVLESIARGGPLRGQTQLFLYPPAQFHMVDALLTNFHLPRSTLLMLVSAFASKPLIKKAYQEAIEKKYRFYSYGDTMLIL